MQNLLKNCRGLIMVIFVLVVGWFVLSNAAPAKAETCTWTAASTTAPNTMSNPGNWTGCTLDATDNLVFNNTTSTAATWDSGLTEVTSVTVSSAYAGTISIGQSATTTGNFVQDGGTVNISSGLFRIGGDLTVGNGAVFNGTSGTVTMFGMGSIGGLGNTTFYNLTLNATSTLSGDITVSNVLSTSGNFNPAIYTLILSGTGTPWQTFGGMVNASTSTVEFTGSGTVTLPQLGSFYNLTFNNAAGNFVFSGGMLPSISNNFTITAGTVSTAVNNQFMVGMGGGMGGGNPGHFINNGTFTQTAGSVSMQGDGSTISGSGIYNFNSLYVATTTLSSDITVNDILTINSGGTFDAATSTITLASSSVPFVVSGVFTPSSSTIIYSGSSATTIATTTYYNLIASSTNASLLGNVTVNNVLTITAGGALNAGTSTIFLTGSGTPFVNNGTFTASTSVVQYSSGTSATIASATYYDLAINTAGTLAGNATTTNNLTILSNKSLNLFTYNIVIGGNLDSVGTVAQTSGTVTMTGANATLGGGGNTTLYDLQIYGTKTTLGGNATTTNDVIVDSGKTLDLSTKNITIGRHLSNSGTVTQTSGTATMTGTGNLGGSGNTTLSALTISGTITLAGNATTTATTTITGAFNGSDKTLILTGSGTPLYFNGGTFNAGTSTVIYAGTGSVLVAAPDSFYNLTLNATSTLSGDITVSNVLSTSGNFNPAIYTLTLSGTGTPWQTFGGMFNASTSTVEFTGSGTVTLPQLGSYYNLTFNNAAGNFVFSGGMLPSISNNFTITAGTVSTAVNNQFMVGMGGPGGGSGGHFINNGTFTQTAGSVSMQGDGSTISGSGIYNFNSLYVATTTLSSDITVNDILTINSGGTFDAATSTITLASSSVPFVVSGVFTPSSSTIIYSGSLATTITTTTYYNLTINTTGTLNSNVSITNNLTVNSNKSLNFSTFDATIGGNLDSVGTVAQTSGTVTMTGANATLGGDGNTTLYDLQIYGTKTTLGGNATTTNDVIVDSGKTLDLSTKNITIGRHLSNSGTVTQTSGTATMTGTGNLGGSGNTTLSALTINGTITLAGNATTTATTTITGAFNGSDKTLILTGSGTPLYFNGGTFNAASSTFNYTNTGSVTTAGETYWNLTLGTGAYTFNANATTTNAFVNGGTAVIPSGIILYAPGTFDNNGTTTESGIIKHPMAYAKLSDSSGAEVSSYSTGSDTVYVNVSDDDGNLHKNSVDTISVGASSAITTDGYSDSESIASITLTETGADTGIFVGTAFPFQVVASKTNNNSEFDVSGNGTLTLAFIDNKDSSDTGADTALFTGSAYTAPAAASSNNSGGIITPTNCASVVYDEWQTTCVNGLQYRNIKSRNPSSCGLTAEQENNSKRQCGQEAITPEKKTTLPEIISETKELIGTTSQINKEFAQKIIDIAADASEIIKVNINSLLGKLGFKRNLAKEDVSLKKYVKNLIKNEKGLTGDEQNKINNFIAYGTLTTQKLGAGERAGVVGSYKSAFGKLPKTESEWNDTIKIANGRWPSKKNEATEANAVVAFKKIYLRNPDRKNPKDDAAATIIAYGLRPTNRNVNSEKTAIKSFVAIYGYYPISASAWDIVRAIAYSGAKR